ncbi:hypothetical protein Syun_012008 [Stephania yunnanensis]|uniref:DUF4378 domain-containing protein n=1 Tax=Stephania yunnanensis TaxID=152371 RepID=A0AAP0JZY9_9MAGN
MPQDRFRSAVYRSIVSCDDPNGVVEGETIRRSRNASRKMERRRSKGRTAGTDLIHPSGSKFEKGEKFIREEMHHTSTSSQLLEVSRGAQKLNQVIDSWSNGMTRFDGQSKDVATDLLRGALDLQESLAVLYELQEASRNMALLKEISQLKSREVDDLCVERTESGRFLGKFYQKGIQNSRLSVDGRPKDSVEELKKVIRESLCKQNLLSISSAEENRPSDQRKWDYASDIPSTSSSQSSVVNSNNSVSTDGAVSSASQQKKGRCSSVIAKLMGLEEFQPQQVQSSSRIIGNDMSRSPWRPMFEIEMPKSRKSQVADQTADPTRKTLKEIIETMRMKGLLKSNHVAHEKYSHISNISQFKEGFNDEMPPIVVIKPLPLPGKKKDSALLEKLSKGKGPQHPIDELHELERSGEYYSKRTLVHQKVALRLEEILGNVEAKEETPAKMLDRVEKASNLEQIHTQSEVRRKTSTKKVFKKKKGSTSLEMNKIREVRGTSATEKISPKKTRASVPYNHKPQKKNEITNKIEEKIPKALKKERIPGQNKNQNARFMSKSQDQIKVTSMKTRRPPNGSMIKKNSVLCHHESTNSTPPSTHSASIVSWNSADRTNRKKIKAKQMKESPTLCSLADSSQHEEPIKDFKLSDMAQSLGSTTSTTITGHPDTKGVDVIEFDDKDQHKEDQSSLCEPRAQICQHSDEFKSEKESKDHTNPNNISGEANNKDINLRSLFLRSLSFLNFAENYFDLDLDQEITIQSNDTNMMTSKLFRDCAYEFIERKSHHSSLTRTPHLSWFDIVKPRINISLVQLVEEVCQGVYNLLSYLEDDDGVQPVDSLYKMLESDLKVKGTQVSSAWDLAWVKGFSEDETNAVISEVEKQILGALIEETILDIY